MNEIVHIRDGPQIGNIYIAGQAKVQLGDVYGPNRDLFEAGTEEERKEALRAALAYDGMLTREQQISLDEISSSSFQWVRATEIHTWLRSQDPFFWIAGKPGSGKSTLMKHLTQSKWTLDTLKYDNKPWKIVYFYFDYRAGKAVANQTLGMLRRFVRQLVNDLELGHNFRLMKMIRSNANSDDYVAFLAEALQNANINVCAFVDGLDEHEGDLWELCQLLDRLQDRTGMKMCLASRPEEAIRNFLGQCVSISMQDHNEPSIDMYIERKIERGATRVPWIHDLFTNDIQTSVRKRAEGVILWAKLVTDEMVYACDGMTTSDQLKGLLDSLPQELEHLYDRILKKIKPHFKAEAALLIHMLSEAGGSQEKNLLYAAWSFLQFNLLHLPPPKAPLNHKVFDTRLNVLLGNMVNTATLTISGGNRYQILVQLLHKSLSSYLLKTNWVAINLPEAVVKRYSTDHFWQRLHAGVIGEASKQQAVRADVLVLTIEKLLTPIPNLPVTHIFTESTHPLQAHNLRTVFKVFMSPPWTPWIDFLQTSLTTFPVFSELSGLRDDMRGPDSTDLCQDLPLLPGSSRLLLLHCAFCRTCAQFAYSPWHQIRLRKLFNLDLLHVFIDLSHRTYIWLKEPLIVTLQALPNEAARCIFDFVITTPKLLTSKDKALLEALAIQGIQLESHHLCVTAFATNIPEIYAAYKYALDCRTADDTPPSHDEHCIFRSVPIDLDRHLLDNGLANTGWTEIFIRCGVHLDESQLQAHQSPGPIDQAILEQRLSNRRSGRTFQSLELQRQFEAAPQPAFFAQAFGPLATLAHFEAVVEEGLGLSMLPAAEMSSSVVVASDAQVTVGSVPASPALGKGKHKFGRKSEKTMAAGSATPSRSPRSLTGRFKALLSID